MLTTGADSTASVAVTVGDVAMDEVRLEFDPSFEIGADVRRPGWEVQVTESSVSFTGGALEPGACEIFEVPVRAATAGTFRVRAFQTLAGGPYVEHPANGDVFLNADGSSYVVDRSGPPNPAFEQVIYVEPGESQQSARAVLLVVSGLALGIVAVVLLRRRRRVGTDAVSAG